MSTAETFSLWYALTIYLDNFGIKNDEKHAYIFLEFVFLLQFQKNISTFSTF